MIFDEWLEKRRKLDAKATKGPWEVFGRYGHYMDPPLIDCERGFDNPEDPELIAILRNEHSQVLDVIEEMREALRLFMNMKCSNPPSDNEIRAVMLGGQALKKLDELGEKE